MRALCIPQPWAHLVVRGVKTLEDRSWFAKHAARYDAAFLTRCGDTGARSGWCASPSSEPGR